MVQIASSARRARIEHGEVRRSFYSDRARLPTAYAGLSRGDVRLAPRRPSQRAGSKPKAIDAMRFEQ
jgi:hypothetical protein